MTCHPSHPPVSALRERMIEDLIVRGIGAKTRHDYVRHVRAFSAFIGRSPDTATAEEVRRFQLHQTETGVGAPSINSAVSALRFLFTVTLDRPDLARRLTVVRQPRKLPLVLSAEEVALLLEAAPGPLRRTSPVRAASITCSWIDGVSQPLPAAETRLGRRTALTLPLSPPPQKNRSPPSDSSPETPTPGGRSSLSSTSPVRGSTRRNSLSSPSQVPCQSSPSIQVTPVTTRLDSMVRRIAPVFGST
jgi:hypothetical protein